MQSQFVVPETTVTEKGTGEAVQLDGSGSGTLLLTLGITDIIEQEALDVSVYGSADGEAWGEKPLRVFPQKFYRGTYSVLMNRGEDVKFLRAQWDVQRWGVGEQTPKFRFYLFVESYSNS